MKKKPCFYKNCYKYPEPHGHYIDEYSIWWIVIIPMIYASPIIAFFGWVFLT